MSIETRHTEKSILYQLLKAEADGESLSEVISYLSATMEPEDVELVQKKIAERKKNSGNK